MIDWESDTMQHVKPDITLKVSLSMGAFLLAAGTKIKGVVLAFRIMIHQPFLRS